MPTTVILITFQELIPALLEDDHPDDMIDEAEILGGEGEGAPQLGALYLQPVRVNVHQHLPQAALRLEEGVRRPDDVAVDAGLGQDIWGVSACSHQLDDKLF